MSGSTESWLFPPCLHPASPCVQAGTALLSWEVLEVWQGVSGNRGRAERSGFASAGRLLPACWQSNLGCTLHIRDNRIGGVGANKANDPRANDTLLCTAWCYLSLLYLHLPLPFCVLRQSPITGTGGRCLSSTKGSSDRVWQQEAEQR